MALPKNRYACLSDLKEYFKKSELLGGLTEFEKKQLRQNIGVIDYTGEAGQITPIEITHAALLNLVETGKIIVGGRYIITDYRTIYVSNTGEIWGDNINPSPIYRILVTGINNDKLDDRAYIIGKPWEIKYSVYHAIPQDKGRITWLRDEHHNTAYYDFKSMRFRRTKDQLRNTTIPVSSYLDLYTFSNIKSGGTVEENSSSELCEYNSFQYNCIDNVFIGDTYNNIFEEECRGNTFIKGCHDSYILWNTVNNLFNEPVCYTSGALYNKTIDVGDTVFSTAITKTIHKVNEATIVSFLDPITYTHQVVIL